MVISVANTNISESSINDLFHNTEISVLEICHEYELDLMKSKALNEADVNSEDKEKDSKFMKFVAAIKQKIEDIFTAAINKIQSIYASIKSLGLLKYVDKKIDQDDYKAYVRKEFPDIKYYVSYSNPFDSSIRNCKIVNDFMAAMERTGIPEAGGITNDNVKILRMEKNRNIKLINERAKKKEVSKEKAVADIRFYMNWYTATVKGNLINLNNGLRTLKAYSKYKKESGEPIPSGRIKDEIDKNKKDQNNK